MPGTALALLLALPLGAQDDAFLIETVRVSSVEERAEVRVTGAGSLVWSRVRVVDGIIAVVVPDADMAEGLAVEGSHPVIEEIEVAASPNDRRDAVMVAVRPSQRVRHVLDIEDGELVLRLTPLRPVPSVARATQSSVEPSSPEPEEQGYGGGLALASAEVLRTDESLGTAGRPFLGPAPEGRPATELSGVERRTLEGARAFVLLGNGEFSYRCFFLPEPDRFAIDLQGVWDQSNRQTLEPGGEGVVSRVRVGQFERRPTPVTRVVFDLARRGKVRTLRTSEGLFLVFE
ncbi:MAG: AMIN domain-containing protein [Acidobacteriota bacterium]